MPKRPLGRCEAQRICQRCWQSLESTVLRQIGPPDPRLPQAVQIEILQNERLGPLPGNRQSLSISRGPLWREDAAASVLGHVAHRDVLVEAVCVGHAGVPIQLGVRVVRDHDQEIERCASLVQIQGLNQVLMAEVVADQHPEFVALR